MTKVNSKILKSIGCWKY